MQDIENRYVKLDHPEVLQALFHPRPEASNGGPDSVDLSIEVEKDITLGARFYPAEPADGPNILFFHGNGEVVGDYDAVAPKYSKQGVGFLAVDFRGYGRSSGVPSASTMISDAHLVLDFCKQYLADQGRTGRLAVMGRSLGSTCAIELASARMQDIDGLILESAFAQTMPILRVFGVDVEALGLSEDDGFANLQKIGSYTKPVLLLHAMKDELIPVAEAGELQAECAAQHKELQVVPGADHNTIMEKGGVIYFDIIKNFCKKMGRPERPKKAGVR